MVTQIAKKYAEAKTCNDVDQPCDIAARFKELYIVQRKGRKRSESAAKAGSHQHPSRLRHPVMPRGKAGEQPDDQASGKIHCQRGPGESVSAARQQQCNGVPEQTTGRTA